ncbi:phage tail protein [Caulobacter sp. SLTY]|uniref:phage tail sheath subtilisin-like domain-containing protein n=1 Tax=Caulobacter sp. SLTY TaxID=2683262 RepID=UPI001412D285|nr:phage tail sheath subtilisin-like domain-containing protein [Caulobacter sp. SLTY]NBB17553.1 phage tail protein [Caulobacter sp. SLTY]
MISFNQIGIDLRTPGVRIEIDASRARQGLPIRTPVVVILGQKTSAGAAAVLTPTRIGSKQAAIDAFGAGSMLAQELIAFMAANTSAVLYGLAQANADGAVAATKTVTYAGPSTAAGVVPIMIGGRQVNTAVASGQTATQIATAVAASVNAAADMPMTATSAAEVLTLTARHAGLAGEGIDVRTLYYDEDKLPAGVTAVVAAGTTGATDPLTSAAIAALGDFAFDFIVTPYTASANLTALETELAARWYAGREIDGIAVTFARGTQGALATLGDGRNSAYLTMLGAKNQPNLPWEWAATYAGVLAHDGFIDPARPFQTLPLPGLLPPAVADRFTRQERELLLKDGISTFTVDAGGRVILERAITQYQEDSAGNADTAFLDVNTPLTLSYLRWSLRLRFAQKYPRHKLADDGVPSADGQAVMTPKVAAAELLAWARDLEEAGLVENVDQFKADLKVERDASDPNRLNALLPPDLVNQFIVFAAKLQFRL